MKDENQSLNFRQKFLDELFAIQEYLNFYGGIKTKHFLESVIDFSIDTIAVNPLAFPECYFLKTNSKIYRRAIFQKDYAIIYKVTDLVIDILTIYHTSRDIHHLKIE